MALWSPRCKNNAILQFHALQGLIDSSRWHRPPFDLTTPTGSGQIASAPFSPWRKLKQMGVKNAPAHTEAYGEFWETNSVWLKIPTLWEYSKTWEHLCVLVLFPCWPQTFNFILFACDVCFGNLTQVWHRYWKTTWPWRPFWKTMCHNSDPRF